MSENENLFSIKNSNPIVFLFLRIVAVIICIVAVIIWVLSTIYLGMGFLNEQTRPFVFLLLAYFFFDNITMRDKFLPVGIIEAIVFAYRDYKKEKEE